MQRLVVTCLIALSLAGCLDNEDAQPQPGGPTNVVDSAPFMGYTPVEPDMALTLLMEDVFVPGELGNQLHARIVRPEGDGPFPVIVQHTPYTAPGCNVLGYDAIVEPPVLGCTERNFDRQFVRRGYAFAYADLSGTGDSDGCLDLRGPTDIADIGRMADAMANQPWSNGNVGFIGASYPGSTSHMAALSGSQAVKAVIPVVASTSFYHYHHNDGVPYNGNHALGGTNTGYTQQGLTPTANPASGAQKLADQPLCPHAENALTHGGLDQTGAYYEWWQDRNLRPLASQVTVPVLMAQGLADWNVKPDHVEHWFNDISSQNKVFIGGQWGHAYPATDEGACRDDDTPAACTTPWGNWWAYAAAFFDTYLKEIDTGMFEGSVAWVQDNNRTWHRSESWPLTSQAQSMRWTLDVAEGDGWYACPHDNLNMGQFAVAAVEAATVQCDDEPGQSVSYQSAPFAVDTILTGAPELVMLIDTGGRTTHITAVMDVLDENGAVSVSRENYGYLNPEFALGLDNQSDVPAGPYAVVLDFYPQEDFIPAGHSLRITLASNDAGRTIEAYEEGPVQLLVASFGADIRPDHLQGVRLA